ncbi:hypothetical protein [Pseudomonas amygdali]|uniref:Uncharacterized protein n=2 Tax=Pseudomonas amygdali pv. lachrymans TaxID=53707 RepID=A0ABR5KQF9_PSEAV|nr:hypothetical protein [Pseudomonas amygdali]AXH59555.1 hypothetical protein PLA107_030480 [Pseudomonas amygdali pv. lachrymans str. M301315]KPC16982.1 Uncharacterized protein AC499_0184 [Pseudomonas amygdali pv. lachrymans]KPC17941.1 Uncharacterized protein AC499_1143 [Pseudomonas amygdali pv. lachrymans]
MRKQPPIPSYALRHGGVAIDAASLASGKPQAEALAFFQQMCGRNSFYNASGIFLEYAEQHAGLISEDARRRNLLNITVALIMLKDIAPVSEYLAKGYVSLSSISVLLSEYAETVSVDLIHQLENKGDVALDNFCMFYSVSSRDLAILAVIKDSVRSVQAFTGQDLPTFEWAMARVTYNPFTAIRAHLGHSPGQIPSKELMTRFYNQLDGFNDQRDALLINGNEPARLNAGSSLECSLLEGLDHKLEVFDGYWDFLRNGHATLLQAFGDKARSALSPNSDKNALTAQLLDHFERSGVSRVDILVKGIFSYLTLSPESYAKCSEQEKLSMYHEILIEDGAYYGESPEIWDSQPKLFQIYHMIRKEPARVMEALCDRPAYWAVLYRATGDKKCLPMLKGRIEKVIAEDLGL